MTDSRGSPGELPSPVDLAYHLAYGLELPPEIAHLKLDGLLHWTGILNQLRNPGKLEELWDALEERIGDPRAWRPESATDEEEGEDRNAQVGLARQARAEIERWGCVFNDKDKVVIPQAGDGDGNRYDLFTVVAGLLWDELQRDLHVLRASVRAARPLVKRMRSDSADSTEDVEEAEKKFSELRSQVADRLVEVFDHYARNAGDVHGEESPDWVTRERAPKGVCRKLAEILHPFFPDRDWKDVRTAVNNYYDPKDPEESRAPYRDAYRRLTPPGSDMEWVERG